MNNSQGLPYQVGESWGFDLAAIGSAGAVWYQIHTKLSLEHTHTFWINCVQLQNEKYSIISRHCFPDILRESRITPFGDQCEMWSMAWISELWVSHLGGFHSCVGCPWRYLVALCVQLEMMDQWLHGHLKRWNKQCYISHCRNILNNSPSDLLNRKSVYYLYTLNLYIYIIIFIYYRYWSGKTVPAKTPITLYHKNDRLFTTQKLGELLL